MTHTQRCDGAVDAPGLSECASETPSCDLRDTDLDSCQARGRPDPQTSVSLPGRSHGRGSSPTSPASRPGKRKLGIWNIFIQCEQLFKKKVIHHDQSLDLLRQDVRCIKEYTYEQLKAATDHFSTGRIIHEDALHALFTGHFKNQGIYALIKKLKDQKELDVWELLDVELRALALLLHPNIVKCIGWCSDSLVVYESMPNGTLYSYLHSPDKDLPWNVRFKAALNLASAILYLHDEYTQKVLHRNITSRNVILASDFNAKLTSFMFAKFKHFGSDIDKTIMLEIPDQIKPLCIREGIVTEAFDIHSFGIVILEIATGQFPSDILEKLWDSSKQHLIAPDKRLDGKFDSVQMERLIKTGLSCSLLYGQTLPTMQEVMRYLEGGEPELDKYVEGLLAPDFELKLDLETFDIGIPPNYDPNGPLKDSHRDMMKGFATEILGKINSGARFEEIHKIIVSFTALMVKLDARLSDWNLFAQVILRELKMIEIFCTRYKEEVQRIQVGANSQVEDMHAVTIRNNVGPIGTLIQRAMQDIKLLELTISELHARYSMLRRISSLSKSLNVHGVSPEREKELADTQQVNDSLMSRLRDSQQKLMELQGQQLKMQ